MSTWVHGIKTILKNKTPEQIILVGLFAYIMVCIGQTISPVAAGAILAFWLFVFPCIVAKVEG